MSDTPRYRCAAERAFLSEPIAISFAKLDNRVGLGCRAEQGDEFDYEGDPARWMEPINEAARERAAAMMKNGKRKTVGAEGAVPTTPLRAPPRSGMTRAITDPSAFQTIKDVRTDENPKSSLSDRPAPKRRGKAS
jgi:hypothetical protein